MLTNGVSVRSALAAMAFAALPATAAPVTYDVNLTFGQGGKAVGFVQTDGALGALNAANILGWEFELTAQGRTRTISNLGTALAPMSALEQSFGPPLYASATELTVGNGLDSGAFIFRNRNSDFSVNYSFTVNPVVNSQLNIVQLAVLLRESGTTSQVVDFISLAPGARFATAQAPAQVPVPATIWLVGGALIAWRWARPRPRSVTA